MTLRPCLPEAPLESSKVPPLWTFSQPIQPANHSAFFCHLPSTLHPAKSKPQFNNDNSHRRYLDISPLPHHTPTTTHNGGFHKGGERQDPVQPGDRLHLLNAYVFLELESTKKYDSSARRTALVRNVRTTTHDALNHRPRLDDDNTRDAKNRKRKIYKEKGCWGRMGVRTGRRRCRTATPPPADDRP